MPNIKDPVRYQVLRIHTKRRHPPDRSVGAKAGGNTKQHVACGSAGTIQGMIHSKACPTDRSVGRKLDHNAV